MSRARRGVVGFDLSLRAPAACFIPPGWRLGEWKDLAWAVLGAAEDPRGEPHAELRARHRRLAEVVDWAHCFVQMHESASGCAADVFVEDYAYSMHSSSVTRLAELGGAVRVEMYRHGWLARTVTASFARKLLLGKLPGRGAGKGAAKRAVEVGLAACGAPFEGDDACDAFCVANAGLSEMGLPFLSLA